MTFDRDRKLVGNQSGERTQSLSQNVCDIDGLRRQRRHDRIMVWGDYGMRHAYLRGKWLRRVTTGAAICLSIATVNSVAICDGPNSLELAQANGKSAVHETEFEDRSQYPGLTMVKPGLSTKVMRKQAIAEIPLNRLTPEAQKKTQSLLNNLGMYRRLPTISFECDPRRLPLLSEASRCRRLHLAGDGHFSIPTSADGGESVPCGRGRRFSRRRRTVAAKRLQRF